MRRPPVPLALALAALLALLAGGSAAHTAAQEGTPPAEGFALEGVGFFPLGFGTAEELPAAPADLVLVRFTLEPGASIPADAGDPSVALVYVEAGALTAEAGTPVRVTRAAVIAAFATPGAEPEGPPMLEEVAAGTAFTLAAGDSVVLPPNVAAELRNDGQERVVGLAAIVAPPEMGGEAGTPAAATPAP